MIPRKKDLSESAVKLEPKVGKELASTVGALKSEIVEPEYQGQDSAAVVVKREPGEAVTLEIFETDGAGYLVRSLKLIQHTSKS